MTAARITISLLAKARFNTYAWTRVLQPKTNFLRGPISTRLLSNHQIRNNIELISQDDKSVPLKSDTISKRPLLVLLAWLSAKRRHYMKIVNFYMEQGFDVVVVTVFPRQLMWPVTGSQPIAADLVSFLEKSVNYEQIVLHGFSVGGYIFGEVLDFISKDNKRYAPMIDRIVGQIWDSAVDVSELSIGTPRAMFPNNVLLQNMMRKYLEYHLRTFYKQSTQYYIRASQQFHSNFVRAPALFFISKADPVGTLTNNLRARDSWESLGTQTYVKIFEQSPHVGHFRQYPKEYITELYMFLDKLGLINDEEKIKARLQS